MMLRVRLFARARDLAHADVINLDLPPGATVADLREHLAARWPALAPLLARSAFALDNEFARDDARLHEHAEVALVPPVSGG
jgi:molybdopterin converting factor subunit 1